MASKSNQPLETGHGIILVTQRDPKVKQVCEIPKTVSFGIRSVLRFWVGQSRMIPPCPLVSRWQALPVLLGRRRKRRGALSLIKGYS